uniref:Uncharacterized protein n=1 Tax=Strombidium inclinatum TaxID=197538 RepID=A0A7S3IDU4_9SPIT|mmetsp:Transcript_11469/g.17265  ORF Transcript_11469/g.17265 Transcript_11469/m.17265 type:complete len:179 (+) Transcript_11469:2610-3146(+)
MSVASAAFNLKNPSKATTAIRIKSPPKFQKNNFKLTGYGTMNNKAENIPYKWPTLRPWFVAHKIKKMEPSYVVTAKFAAHAKVFISGTTHGEVKLWDNMNLDPLGIVNSPDWQPSRLYIHWKYTKQVEEKHLTRKQQAIMQPVEGLSGATPASRRSPQKSRRSQKNLGVFKDFEFSRK